MLVDSRSNGSEVRVAVLLRVKKVPAGPASADWFEVFPKVLIGADVNHFGAPGTEVGKVVMI
jgi:hypothetical protein